jgi:hypothetical protein
MGKQLLATGPRTCYLDIERNGAGLEKIAQLHQHVKVPSMAVFPKKLSD